MLRELRRENSGYRQEDIAKIIGCSRASVASWETGASEPRLHTISDLLSLYDYELTARPKRKR